MPFRLSRRRFLAAMGAAPFARAQNPGTPRAVDVVVVGGDPAVYSAVYRLTRSSGLRVLLVDDAVPWRPSAPPPASLAALPPFVRGHQVCFDSWRDLGNQGWGYLDVLPSFKRLERYEVGESGHRGGSGPLSVTHCWDPHALHRAFLLASVSGGFHQDSRHDFNGPRSQSYASYYQKTILDDRPHTFDAAFLDPARASGSFTHVTGAVVTRLVFDRTRATGIEIARGSVRETIRAERGVLLCAAPDRAAQLLLLSGVGPADHLRAMGVGVVADRPGVGRNLHDHVRVSLRWQATPAALDLPESSVAAGMFTVSLNASPPDLQMDFVDPRMAGAPLLGIDVTLVQPSSRGDVRLRSADPLDPPVISTNILGTDADLLALVQGVRLARLVGESPQLDRMRADEREPSRTAQALPGLRSFVRATATARGHLAGTCAMGRAVDSSAVVDATLSVHGVQGLRVAGAAVMPVVVNAPPAAAALMIGDRAGEWAAEPAR